MNFSASRPDELCVADITYVSTWAAFPHLAFRASFPRGIFPPRVSGSRDPGVHAHQTSACGCAQTSVAVPPLPSEQLPLILLPPPGPIACRKTFVQYGANSAESFPVPPQVPTTVRHPFICNRDRLLPLE